MASKHNRGVTECSICLKTLKIPKMLPCKDTFCLQCLQLYVKDETGSTSSCPLCKNVFSIPTDGIDNLPNNLFIDQLLQVSHCKLARKLPDQTLCELCSESYIAWYCEECDQDICDHCAVIHRKQRFALSHQLVSIDDKPPSPKRRNVKGSYCKLHFDKTVDLYCCDCKTMSCTLCHVKDHNKHACTDVTTASEELGEQLKVDMDQISACCIQLQTKIDSASAEMKSIFENATTAEGKVSEKCDELVSLIRTRQCQLIGELNSCKDTQLKKLENVIEEFQKERIIMNDFHDHCQEVKDKGTVFDMCSSADDLRVRSKELIKVQEAHGSNGLSSVELMFLPSAAGSDAVSKLIGKLASKDRWPILWHGNLLLKNDSAQVQMHFISGNQSLVPVSLPESSVGLRIVQKMHLEASPLEQVLKRMKIKTQYSALLAVPYGRNSVEKTTQADNLRTRFIQYLQQKEAAGISFVTTAQGTQPKYVIHIFPPCPFSSNHLNDISDELVHAFSEYLLILVTTC